MDQYSNYIALSRYARWLPGEGRRETWEESVNRYIDFMATQGKLKGKDLATLAECRNEIVDLGVMGSMRAIMTAGEALSRDNVAGFNCSYLSISRQRALDELMYILMCGTGVGFSVEEKYTRQLPVIAEEFYGTDTTIIVGDSKIGWDTSFRELISLLYSGKIPKWDTSKVRPAGTQLKTFGGRASGPGPLKDAFKFAVNTFNRFKGKQLPPIAVLDLCCKIAEIVVVGGVRRSALIALTDLFDKYAAKAKSPQRVIEYTLLGYSEDETKRKYSVIVDDDPYGERSLILELCDYESEQLQSSHTVGWWHVHPERALANISAVFEGTPSTEDFMQFWLDLMKSGSGERGIFNRQASINQAAKNGRRDSNQEFGTNPCSEIILRDRQFCNLSEVVVRSDDSFDDLKRKVKVATILGTLQSTLTDFRYLSKKWKENTEEEALLGVSLTGIMDHPVLSGSSLEGKFPAGYTLEDILEKLKEVSVETNKEWAEKLGVKQSAAITCVKPSGTVSQLVDSASGIHTRHSPYYIRTIRADKKDPLAKFMIDKGFPHEADVTKPDSTWVFSFPRKSPEGSIFREDRSAIQQLEHWLLYQEHYCEHKPSVTISVKEDEWMDVGAWCFKNFDKLSGVSFLPYDGGTYKQAPYQEITEEEYNEWIKKIPEVDWSELGAYEKEDNTIGSQELACTGSSCEIL